MSLFKHHDIKTYLRQYIQGLPKKGRGESSRIARELGVSSTLVSQVLAGDKQFTQEQAQRLVSYLGLSDIEGDYFMFLVQYERAGSVDLRRFWKAKLEDLRARSLKLSHRVRPKRVLNEAERSRFYSSALYSAMRLFTSVGDKGKSLTEICERFELPRGKASEMLKFMVDVGLCTESGERYFLGAQSTHLEQGSHHLLRHHANWRLRALARSENLSEQELMYTAPVSLSKADFASLREEMVGFIKGFLTRVHASPAEEVACFALDFFWIER